MKIIYGLIYLLLAGSAFCQNYDFVVKKESAALAFKRFQELRESQDPECGKIFLTPSAAAREISVTYNFTNMSETKLMMFLCKFANLGFREDKYGNYYVLLAGETFQNPAVRD